MTHTVVLKSNNSNNNDNRNRVRKPIGLKSSLFDLYILGLSL